ncbi:hypothetical protein COEREDRAFT_82679 [Coemansia reversa NRRL 1564]|uniref:LysM domain-containing protein n=1 Tax=Coemansia reversa (strain ATCC 12441 / NRRL 1564) TaxID=763665 RepID=A0A2G5B6C2_COERN|nr:hypothetical protein COEREDRAFT_82679 [Coemansia reversa NRRL 1564]|eukprot:PIA14550.1 hypothetical protein COEREDRAFT_82679 [Coemansia reversa NRRL 1564]
MFYFRSIVLLVTALLVSAPLSSATDPEFYYGEEPHESDCIMYEVRPGDYCYKIASDNGISYKQFLKQNPGIDCTNLQVGQSVCLIPTSYGGGGWNNGGDNEWSKEHSDNTKYKDKCHSYIVKEGDLCSRIAHNHGISFDKLVELNQNSYGWRGCTRLHVGQKLCV